MPAFRAATCLSRAALWDLRLASRLARVLACASIAARLRLLARSHSLRTSLLSSLISAAIWSPDLLRVLSRLSRLCCRPVRACSDWDRAARDWLRFSCRRCTLSHRNQPPPATTTLSTTISDHRGAVFTATVGAAGGFPATGDGDTGLPPRCC